MADPVVTTLVQGTSATTTTTVSFTGQAANSVLVLCVSADDYRTTTGTGRPESTGFALVTGGSQQTFLGHYMWWKKTDGSDTSVQYTIGSASRSAHVLIAMTNIDPTTAIDVSNGQFTQAFGTNQATPTVTTTAGRRIGVASIGAMNDTGAITGYGSWTNSYVEVGESINAAGVYDSLAVATFTFDGGGTTSTTATISGNRQASAGIISVFKVDTGGGGSSTLPPPLIMQTRRAF